MASSKVFGRTIGLITSVNLIKIKNSPSLIIKMLIHQCNRRH